MNPQVTATLTLGNISAATLDLNSITNGILAAFNSSSDGSTTSVVVTGVQIATAFGLPGYNTTALAANNATFVGTIAGSLGVPASTASYGTPTTIAPDSRRLLISLPTLNVPFLLSGSGPAIAAVALAGPKLTAAVTVASLVASLATSLGTRALPQSPVAAFPPRLCGTLGVLRASE